MKNFIKLGFICSILLFISSCDYLPKDLMSTFSKSELDEYIEKNHPDILMFVELPQNEKTFYFVKKAEESIADIIFKPDPKNNLTIVIFNTSGGACFQISINDNCFIDHGSALGCDLSTKDGRRIKIEFKDREKIILPQKVSGEITEEGLKVIDENGKEIIVPLDAIRKSQGIEEAHGDSVGDSTNDPAVTSEDIEALEKRLEEAKRLRIISDSIEAQKQDSIDKVSRKQEESNALLQVTPDAVPSKPEAEPEKQKNSDN